MKKLLSSLLVLLLVLSLAGIFTSCDSQPADTNPTTAPTATASPEPTATPTPEPTATPTPTPEPTATPEPTPVPECIDVCEYSGNFGVIFKCPESMFNTVIKDADGYLDTSSCGLKLSDGTYYPLNTWDTYFRDEASKCGWEDVSEFLSAQGYSDIVSYQNDVRPLNSWRLFTADKNSDGTDEYYMEMLWCGLLGCPTHGGWNNSTAESFEWETASGETKTLPIYFDVEFPW